MLEVACCWAEFSLLVDLAGPLQSIGEAEGWSDYGDFCLVASTTVSILLLLCLFTQPIFCTLM